MHLFRSKMPMTANASTTAMATLESLSAETRALPHALNYVLSYH
jgi:hypothetical protein